MYRVDTYQRVIARIHELRHQQSATSNLIERIELSVRIDNLKNMIILHSLQN